MSQINRQTATPHILIISQWPDVKNGEYELIEKIKQIDYKITVVDYLGFNVETGECINQAGLYHEFDFAIALHYDTPKFIDIPTFLWLANPLEFMHLRHDYKSTLVHNLRAYDDYLYNGSDKLKTHISHLVGSDWRDSFLEMYPSSTSKMLTPLKIQDRTTKDTTQKIFYCGINWEKVRDKAGRRQGLLDALEVANAADFYGPKSIAGINPWIGFSSYKGEIPFDGISMNRVMRRYAAVLAISSPIHIKSQTSSSRVFEGFNAGVPVISDENYHVRKLFGDLVYYFQGDTPEQQRASIQQALVEIGKNPAEARDKVMRAQTLIAEKYSFEHCFDKALSFTNKLKSPLKTAPFVAKFFDIFLFHHDPSTDEYKDDFQNIDNLLEAAGFAAQRHKVTVCITYCGAPLSNLNKLDMPTGVSWQQLDTTDVSSQEWHMLRLGEKVALLAERSTADFTTYLTQFDFPHYDRLSKALDWFAVDSVARANATHISGYFVSNLASTAKHHISEIHNNKSISTYVWSQDSLVQHQMASLVFSGTAKNLLSTDLISCFDTCLPISIILSAITQDYPIHRSRHILLRIKYSHFQRHQALHAEAVKQNYWSEHYGLICNYTHELNALFDIHHESPLAMSIIKQVSGENAIVLNHHSISKKYGFKLKKLIPKKLRPLYKRICYSIRML